MFEHDNWPEHVKWLNTALEMAERNVKDGGGPFAAVVVKGEQIVGNGVNRVEQWHDPTAHAELLAIREACAHLQTTDLSDCLLYASGEPCPMCMGAIYWARPKAVFFACTKREAFEAYGFPDPLAQFYAEQTRPPAERTVAIRHIAVKDRLKPFQAFAEHASGRGEL